MKPIAILNPPRRHTRIQQFLRSLGIHLQHLGTRPTRVGITLNSYGIAIKGTFIPQREYLQISEALLRSQNPKSVPPMPFDTNEDWEILHLRNVKIGNFTGPEEIVFSESETYEIRFEDISGWTFHTIP